MPKKKLKNTYLNDRDAYRGLINEEGEPKIRKGPGPAPIDDITGTVEYGGISRPTVFDNASLYMQRTPGVSTAKYNAEMDAARAKAQHVNPAELPQYNINSLKRRVSVSQTDLGDKPDSTNSQDRGQTMLYNTALGRIENARFKARGVDPSKYYPERSPANMAASWRNVAAIAQYKDADNTTKTGLDIARTVGDKAAMAHVTGKTLMPTSTSDADLDAMLDAYEKSIKDETISTPKDREDTLKRIQQYRTDPAARERLRLSQNDKATDTTTAIAESLNMKRVFQYTPLFSFLNEEPQPLPKPKKIRIPNVRDAQGELISPDLTPGRDDIEDDKNARWKLMSIGGEADKHLRDVAIHRYMANKDRHGSREAFRLAINGVADYRSRKNPYYNQNKAGDVAASDSPMSGVGVYYEKIVPRQYWETPENPAWIEKEIDDGEPAVGGIKEHVKHTIKSNVIQNFFENAKPEFARRGSGHQRPKSWNKGTKSGSEKKKSRREGKREAAQLNENPLVPDIGKGFIHAGIKAEVGHEDTPEFRQRQSEAMTRGIVRDLAPLYQRHGIGAQDLEYTSDHGFPALASFINHPNFEAFTRDFIRYHAGLNAQYKNKSGGRSSGFHIRGILHGKKQLEDLAKHRAYLARTSDITESAEELEAQLEKDRTPHQLDIMLKQIKAQKAFKTRRQYDMQENWENREQQRTHASHEDPMIAGSGEPANADEILAAEGRRELDARFPLVPQHFKDTIHQYSQNGEHAQSQINGALLGALEWMAGGLGVAAKSTGKGAKKELMQRIEEMLQHHHFVKHVQDRRMQELMSRMRASQGTPPSGDIPF